jgi:protein gp37
MGTTSIEWCDKTWNPTRGCSLVSPGCTNCYAMGQAHRFSGKGKPFEGLTKKRVKLGVVWTGKVRLAPDMLALPLSWKKPQRVFVNSMSDLFHEELSNEDIAAVFGVMAAAPRHTFQVLTKRAKRMREWFAWVDDQVYRERDAVRSRLMWLALCAENAGEQLPITTEWQQRSWCDEWPLPNVWLGVSAEDQQSADERIPELLCTPAAVRFVSYEPALGPVDLTNIRLDDDSTLDALWDDDGELLDWIIVGGESGPRARPFDVAWARSVVEQCKAAGVACFVKQLGANTVVQHPFEPATLLPAKLASRKGDDMSEWPADLRVREWPTAQCCERDYDRDGNCDRHPVEQR